jgi:hypothetical protein
LSTNFSPNPDINRFDCPSILSYTVYEGGRNMEVDPISVPPAEPAESPPPDESPENAPEEEPVTNQKETPVPPEEGTGENIDYFA